MYARIPIFVLAVLVMVACNDAADSSSARPNGYSQIPATREDSLFKEVMQGHDIGMARMGKLSKNISLLQEKLDSIELLSDAEAQQLEPLRKDYESILAALKQADDGMSDWMHDFRADSGQGNPQVRIAYLENEKVKVEKVKQDILESLQKADSLLNSNK